MKPRYFWIKERHNPQLGVYYVGCGQLSLKAAKKLEFSCYGSNTMLRYSSEVDYLDALQKLKDSGKTVQ